MLQIPFFTVMAMVITDTKPRPDERRHENLTRRAIIASAEKLFAERGYDGTSVRDILRDANVNSGALHYYFGTKQALFEEVFDRLAEPLVAERLARLAECRQAPERPDMLERILSAHLKPGLIAGFENAESRQRFARIRAQLIQGHHPFMADLLERHFTTTGEEFLAELARVLPGLSSSDLQWRYHMMVAALTITMGGPWKLQLGQLNKENEVYEPENTEEALRQMITLSAAMFRAPTLAASDTELPGT